MPITSIPSHVTTGDAILAHWTNLEATTLSTFTLTNGQGKDDLLDVRNDVESFITAVEAPSNARAIASNDLLLKRAELSPIISNFNRAVRYRFKTGNYPKALPRTPGAKAGFGAFVKACDDVANLWATINANSPAFPGFTPPLLVGTLTLAQFNTKVTALKAAFTTLTNKEQDLRLSRETRNAQLAPFRSFMVLYRQAVLASFPASSPLVASLPAVYPPPGSTPAAVNFGAAWDAALGKAVCVWTVSSDPNLQEYEVRACDPPTYKAADEEVVDSLPPGTNELETDFGLLVSGSAKIFAVYVMTTTGNEKRSNTVKVTRP